MDSRQTPDDAVTANGTTSALLRQAAEQRAGSTSRRAMLRRGGVVAAAAAGLTLLDQRRAQAADGGTFFLGSTNDATSPTELHPHTNGQTTVPLFHVNGSQLSGTSTTMIVDGPGEFQGVGLVVNGNTGGTGVVASAANGPKGTVGLAMAVSGANGADAIHASSDKGVGVSGHGKRGGVFSGSAAQVNLVASAGTHPAKGQRGDLFVDRFGRLFFCHGGTHWTRLA